MNLLGEASHLAGTDTGFGITNITIFPQTTCVVIASTEQKPVLAAKPGPKIAGLTDRMSPTTEAHLTPGRPALLRDPKKHTIYCY